MILSIHHFAGQLSWERIRNYHTEHNKKALLTQDEESASSQQAKRTSKKKFKGATAVSTWRSTTHGIRTILTVGAISELSYVQFSVSVSQLTVIFKLVY